jgi:hypothetical protein
LRSAAALPHLRQVCFFTLIVFGFVYTHFCAAPHDVLLHFALRQDDQLTHVSILNHVSTNNLTTIQLSPRTGSTKPLSAAAKVKLVDETTKLKSQLAALKASASSAIDNDAIEEIARLQELINHN